MDRSTSYPEVKTILKVKQPQDFKNDPYSLLPRREKVIVFRPRAGHNYLNYHLYSKLRIGHAEQWPCGTVSQTTEHLLQFCPLDELLSKGMWEITPPWSTSSTASWGTYDVLPPSSKRLEFPSDKREEQLQ